jgi:glyoxylase-like metal-dependent hydrolase (beta-lactamase superfamily II)/8-oxo-dGTP pyrophosphatase MutT (NUDIX family)
VTPIAARVTVTPRPASTIALLRAGPDGPEVLLTHRPPTMAFGPGLHVFPGGAVDPADADGPLVARSALDPAACAAAWAGDLEPPEAAAHAIAAIRELYEEAGVVLATLRDGSQLDPVVLEAELAAGTPLADLVGRHDLVLRTDLLVPLSHWVTPPVDIPRRYDTRFYVAALEGAALRPDDREVAAHEWIGPTSALEACAAGRIALWPPTSTTLRQLAPARGIADVRTHLAPLAAAAAPATAVLGDALIRVRTTGAGGIPGLAVNTYLVGRRQVVVVDPGDPGESAMDAILAAAAARGAVITGVILTSPVPDHAGGAHVVAARFGVLVLAAASAARDASVLVDGPVRGIHDGDEVTLGDVLLRTVATPGTHPGHLTLWAPSVGVLMTGDLDGPGPSRGIPEQVDAGALGGSLARVRAIPAALRLPAHG